MKKIKNLFVLLLLFSFCFEPAAFAAEDVFSSTNQQDVEEKAITTEKPALELSSIEELFNNLDAIDAGKILYQVGYDIFSGAGASTSSTTGKYGGGYTLSIGESVNVYMYGDSVDVMALSGSNLVSPVTKAQVDSSGNIFIQGIGPVRAENRTLQEVENTINSMAANKFSNTKVKLTIASGQDFSVFVYGYVNRPGKVLVGNNSSILDVLTAAGGVNKNGTLRNIKYTSGKKTQTVDLYNAIFTGNDNNIIVKPNDKIFVDKIGKVVAFKNGVQVPGIYEAKDNETLQSLANYAGGLAPLTQKTTVTLTRLDSATNQRDAQNISWKNANSTKIHSGDIFEFKKLFNEVENTVTIQGNIKHPATYAYKKGMRLSDILKSEDELQEETFINQAVIRRVSGDDKHVTIIPVFLKEFFAGMNDPVLEPKDIISVYKNTNSQFIDVYGCINSPKHLTYTERMTLKDAMTGIQFIESDVDNQANGEVNVAYSKNMQAAAAENKNKLIPAENIAVEITSENPDNKTTETKLYYLYDIMINSDRIGSIVLNANDKVFFRTLRPDEDLKKVKISGYVKTPGVYKFIEGKKLRDMIELSGGLLDDADLRGIVYTRQNIRNKQIAIALKNNKQDIQLIQGRVANSSSTAKNSQEAKLDAIKMLEDEQDKIANKYTGQIALNINSNKIEAIRGIDNIIVQDGDEIYIPRISKTISVIGEVYQEQSFIYKKGAKANYYIRKVGGYTPNASKFRKYKIGVNGKATKIRIGGKIEEGDVIVVPRKVSNGTVEGLQTFASTFQSVASLFTMVFGITKW